MNCPYDHVDFVSGCRSKVVVKASDRLIVPCLYCSMKSFHTDPFPFRLGITILFPSIFSINLTEF